MLREVVVLRSEDKISAWLDSVGVKNYTINEDLSVDVKGDVFLTLPYSQLINLLLLQTNLPPTIFGQPIKEDKLLPLQTKSPPTLIGQPSKFNNLFPLQLKEPSTLTGQPFNEVNLLSLQLKLAPTSIGQLKNEDS